MEDRSKQFDQDAGCYPPKETSDKTQPQRPSDAPSPGSATVVDFWDTRMDRYRLIKKAEGPMELQVWDTDKWRPESAHFIHSTLCNRIKNSANAKSHTREN